MNKNPLLFAFFRVGLFWYLVLLIFGMHSNLSFFYRIIYFLPDLSNGLIKALLGGVMGAIIYAIIYFSKKMDVHHNLLPQNTELLSVSIGSLPIFREFKQSNQADIPVEFQAWFDQYQSTYPVFASFFEVLVRVIQAYPDIPASPIPGGHGNLSLEAHSWNTLRFALQHQAKWKYSGLKNKLGEIVVPVKDHNYVFFPDPLIPLAAFCHDIGKIVCYRWEGKVIKEVKPNHDEEGARVVATFSAFRELSKNDQEALLVAVGFYHHWRSIPLHVDDRAYALAEFVLYVDKLSGKAENRLGTDEELQVVKEPAQEEEDQNLEEHFGSYSTPAKKSAKRKAKPVKEKNILSSNESAFLAILNESIEGLASKNSASEEAEAVSNTAVVSSHPEQGPVITPTKESESKKTPLKVTDQNLVQEKSPADISMPASMPEGTSVASLDERSQNPKRNVKKANLGDEGIEVQIEGFKSVKRKCTVEQSDKAFRLFMDVLKENSGCLSSQDRNNVGYKYKNRCFINEQGLRNLVSTKVHDVQKENMKKPALSSILPHPFTLSLLWALHDRAMLVREFTNQEGRHCLVSPNQALFSIKLPTKVGSITKDNSIVFSINDDSFWAHIPDLHTEPIVIKPMSNFTGSVKVI